MQIACGTSLQAALVLAGKIASGQIDSGIAVSSLPDVSGVVSVGASATALTVTWTVSVSLAPNESVVLTLSESEPL